MLMGNKKELLSKSFKPESLLVSSSHVPEKAKFPVIDAHNHLFGDVPAEDLVRVMDEVGVKTFVNVTGNVILPFDEKGYTIQRRDLEIYLDHYAARHPGRFLAFTMSDFARWEDLAPCGDEDTLPYGHEDACGHEDAPWRVSTTCGDFALFRPNAAAFVESLVRHLEEDVQKGARGLKVTKELGLRFKDRDGSMLRVDDERLYPAWKRAGELGIPVLIHTSDPVGLFLPVNKKNEHYHTLREFPGWSFYGSRFSKKELLEQRNRMIAAHPQTRFICPHVANHAEDLESVARFLDSFPNVSIDFSARIDELGRRPYTARDFMISYQDRILFGTDMPISPEVYRCYFRFLETKDEYFDYPDYLGRWGRCRWKIYGLNLPDKVLRKIYYENVIKIVPGLTGF